MAMQQRKRRRRTGGNNSNNNNSNNPNKHFESNGPDVRIRGSAAQILEKYQQYARDAQTSGDRVKAEALFQHAEHYARIVAEITKEQDKVRLEREARDAEKSAREAEERAERMAKAEERAAERVADEEKDPGDAPEAKADDDDGDTPAPRRRTRKPRAEATESKESDTDTDAEKPKRRRRTYAAKDDAVEEDGVLKTLSRGAETDA